MTCGKFKHLMMLFYLRDLIWFWVISQVGGSKIRIGGMAKGSGMIHPNMATMLGVICSMIFLLLSLQLSSLLKFSLL